ncbi:MAG TPA: BNR repeat-containing protein [Polyangiaceae bacterium]|nr:BNR repeat-containing protein [Polyangiaceae bacterium]
MPSSATAGPDADDASSDSGATSDSGGDGDEGGGDTGPLDQDGSGSVDRGVDGDTSTGGGSDGGGSDGGDTGSGGGGDAPDSRAVTDVADVTGVADAADVAEVDASSRDSAGPRDAEGGASGDGATGPIVVKMLDITDVWSGHPVGFSLLTRGDSQYAAFYDAQRAMTVARRALAGDTWDLVRLPTSVGWDSHNYVTMAIDDDGYIHVAGNMHSVPLVYFRTTQALDIHSFVQVPSMVGSNEQSCTYPQFFRGPAGALIFAYRDGVSGSGNYVFNSYDLPTRTWKRLLATPLVDGQGARNAYPVGPLKGPDGFFHLVWVWRETADAATNHDLSYARTNDLVAWQTGGGQPLTLPISLATSDIVDPVPERGGMINNNTKVGFDSQKRPVVAYHKFDANGNTQLYNARFENGRWVTYPTSSWNYRWDFSGTGTLVFQIELEGVKVQPDGSLTQTWYHAQYGGWGAFRLDETTLRAVATIAPPLPYPRALDQPESTTPGMIVRWCADSGESTDGVSYLLRWETLASNQDMPRATIPPPTKLRLYGFR